MRRLGRRIIGPLALVLAAGIGLTACSKDDGPEPILKAFLQGWQTHGDLSKIGFLDSTGKAIPAADVAEQIKRMSGELTDRPITFQSAKPTEVKDDASAGVTVNWQLSETVVWRYQITVRLQKRADHWAVVWTPETLHPDLQTGDKLTTSRIVAPRGDVVDSDDQPIVKDRPIVVVGVEPRRVANVDQLIARLDAAFKSVDVNVDLSDLPKEIAAAKPDSFLEIVTLRREVYDRIRDDIQPLGGTVFREGSLPLAPTRVFARALLGRVGEVQKDYMDAHPGEYQVGDLVGQGGLQEEYEGALRGSPGIAVKISGRVDQDGKAIDLPEIFKAEPQKGQTLHTTLDPKIQIAADEALAGESRRSALVAIRVTDGAIVAVANGPDGGGENLAFTAQAPPGSTFKMVSALGLLDAGAVTLDSTVACPATFTVEGRTFKNSFANALGDVPFRVDFAKSCNTAFASLAPKLGADGLAKAAQSVGIGVPWQLGTPAFTGSVQTGASPVEAAAAAFGQGQTLVSPVALAGAAAAVARGKWQAPLLIKGVPVGPGISPPPPPSAIATPPLKDTSVTALRTMMREVVTDGTATSLKDVPGSPVQVKTGTAEYDNNPEHAHTWVLGWQGDIAFAVFLENGGRSTTTVVPIAGKFLSALNR
jgi:cell division protein FtsI/penicillin-binding protein 2